MRSRGGRVVIVSGGFLQFTRAIAARIGADEDRANELETADGRLTGRVIEPVLGPDAKLSALKEIAAAMSLKLAETLAVGDGANDLAMLEAPQVSASPTGRSPRSPPRRVRGSTTATSPRCSSRKASRARSS
jgi:phosphoserine phosphatase